MASPMNSLIEKMKADLRSGKQHKLDTYRNQYAASGSWSDRQLQAAYDEASSVVAHETEVREATKARATEQANAQFDATIKQRLGLGRRTASAKPDEKTQAANDALREMLAEKQHKFSV